MRIVAAANVQPLRQTPLTDPFPLPLHNIKVLIHRLIINK